MAPDAPDHQEVSRREAVDRRAEEADKELDSTTLGEQEREEAEQAFNSILELGIVYAKEKPENAKKLGSEKMLTILTNSTFKTLEQSGMPLTSEQKEAVAEMVKNFLSKVGEGQKTAKIDLGRDDHPEENLPQSETTVDTKQSPLPTTAHAENSIDLSVVKDGSEYMDSISNLENQLNGNKEHDGPIKEQITALNIANLMYEFSKKGKEPNLNGQISVGSSKIQLTSLGDAITANVDNRFTFQYSRASIKNKLGI